MTEPLIQVLKGIDSIVPRDEFTAALKSGQRFNIKFGADPTSADLHLGHLVVLKKLRQFQDAGHSVTFIIGDYTARIGDPTGRSETRPPLSAEAVLHNAQTYQTQVFRILDRTKTTVVHNSSWLEGMNTGEILSLMAKTTVAQLLEREDFKLRFGRKQSIGLHEFMYPLLQGYDSVHLKSQVEIGGSDQTFNLLMGRQLQKVLGQIPQFVLTLPLLEGLDGVHKMSKSLGNHIAFNDSAIDQYGKIMSLPDAMMERYFTLLTDESPEAITGMMNQLKSGDLHPKTLKQSLGRSIVGLFYDPEAVQEAEAHFEKIFSQHQVPNDMPELALTEPVLLIEVLTNHMELTSRAEAKRLIQAGAVSIDQQKIQDLQQMVQVLAQPQVIKAGKRKFLKILPKQ